MEKIFGIMFTILQSLITVYIYNVDKKYNNPYFIFNIWWTIVFFGSSLGLYGLFIPEPQTFLNIWIGIISFNTVYIYKTFKDKKSLPVIESFEEEHISKDVLFIIVVLNCFFIFILFYQVFTNISLFNEGFSISQIRYLYFYTDNIIVNFLRLFTSFFIEPISTVGNILLFDYLFKNNFKKHYLVFMVSTFVLNLFLILSSLGRGKIVSILLIMIFSFILNFKNFKNKKHTIKLIIYVLIIFIIILAVMTRSRDIYGDSFFKNIYLYYSSPIIYFEKLKNHTLLQYGSLRGVPIPGTLFFSGILDFLYLGLRTIGLSIKQPTYYLAEINQNFLEVGDGILYNAFPTMFYSFVFDFGSIGIIIGPVIYSLIIHKGYSKYIQYNSVFDIGIYIVLLLSIYESPMKFLGTSYSFWTSIIYLYIFKFINNSRKKNEI